MKEERVALLHPGAMGATIGASIAAGGNPVGWASHERSPATRARAEAAELHDLGDIDALLEWSTVVVSVCPPDAALTQARTVCERGFTGTYADLNAVSPATALDVESIIRDAGATYVDGGIIGPPASKRGTTRIYLSGPHAAAVAALFSGGLAEAFVIGAEPGKASALKMTYAAYTKGSSALLIAVRSLARAAGVEDALLDEWAKSLPGLDERSDQAARANAPKAWRFVGEMHQIADTFEGHGMPSGFHRAAAEVYESLIGFKDRFGEVDASAAFDAVAAGERPPTEKID